MANLITLTEYKRIVGIKATDTSKDAEYTVGIPFASAAVLSFAERDFGVPNVTEDRTYTYDGSGYLDIDDAQTVNSVTLSIPSVQDYLLDVQEWQAGPMRRDDAPVYYWIELYSGYALFPMSPEMGFIRNIDRLAAEGRWIGRRPVVKVNATWGWPTIPEDVKIAVAWTMRDWLTRPGGEGVTAEAIVDYSRTYGSRGAGGAATPMLAVPNNARDLLAHYAKINV